MEYQTSSSTSSDFDEDSYSTSDIEIDFCVEENPKVSDYEMFLEKSKIFNSFFENILKCSSIRSGETILSFLMELKYDKLLKNIQKGVKKTINKVLESNKDDFCPKKEEGKRIKTDDISTIKERMILLYTERFCDLDPTKVLELYKNIEIDEKAIYLVFSKLTAVEKIEKKEIEKEFSDFDKNYLDFLPDRIEEIFFLKATEVFKTTNIDGKDFRIFFLTSTDLKKFIDLLVNEIK